MKSSSSARGEGFPTNKFGQTGSPSRLRSPRCATPMNESFNVVPRTDFEEVSIDKLDKIVEKDQAKLENLDEKMEVHYEQSPSFNDMSTSLRIKLLISRMKVGSSN
eukprot:CAMPEP_0184730976 /NCGR_PEP_ID=MMETSP0314-20130426/49383_1 /TAXON_ID=38298 /ORGANISM="Rhodella maculata, Strain CCMP 736" /LENGTH=105 /DNA_ID=CAMNT_0027197265 /DNA_START=25 /DNA_END=342 /DNA_ORIENTATION=+